MDSTTFTNITGTPVTDAARFEYLSCWSAEALEEALGYPLDPSDWPDQYEEIGKASSGWSGNLADLAASDEVQGATRLYKWSRYEPYLFIDPAYTIYSIKLVRMDSYGSEDGNGVTFETLSAYTLRMQNGRGRAWGKYVEMTDTDWSRNILWFQLPSLQVDSEQETVQLAVDADWAFEDVPSKLLEAQADMIGYKLDAKRDVTSEKVLGHSYTKSARQDPLEAHAQTFAAYAGPNGTAGSKLVIA